MQYLSKAYNYYSGINPATLSGAIDVIVVRSVSPDGEVTLSSGPFHVRFGKFQVIRPGEKRVTVHLPNNLPAPHIAPFNMKVVESGEAFWVIETDEDVPDELLTSPVVKAEDTDLPPTPGPSDQDFLPLPPQEQEPEAGPSLTQQPFGATERMADHRAEIVQAEPRVLGDVEFLDLNAATDRRNSDHGTAIEQQNLPRRKSTESLSASAIASAVSPSSILNTATSLLPSIPFLSASSSKSNSPKKAEKRGRSNQESPVLSATANHPNPIVAQPGESTDLPDRDHKLATVEDHPDTLATASKNAAAPSKDNQAGDNILPKVKDGEGEGPTIVYAKDIVLDTTGYHALDTPEEPTVVDGKIVMKEKANADEKKSDKVKSEPGSEDKSSHKDRKISEAVESAGLPSALLETFANDLMASARPLSQLDRPPPLVARSTDPSLPLAPSPDIKVPTEELASISTPDLPSALASLNLDSDHPDTQSSPSPRRRFDRGQSEPPESMTEPAYSSTPIPQRFPILPGSPSRFGRPPLGAIVGISGLTNADIDHAWDWARLPSTPTLPVYKNEGEVDDIPLNSEGMERSSTNPLAPSTPVSESEKRVRTESGPPVYCLSIPTPPTVLTPGQTGPQGKLKNVEEDPFMFHFEVESGRSHAFELSLCGAEGFAPHAEVSAVEETAFLKNRVTFQKFIEDPHIVDDPRLVIRYNTLYLTWTTGYHLLFALAMYRRSLLPPTSPRSTMPPLNEIGVDPKSARPSSGYGWSRWWRRGQSSAIPEPPRAPGTPIEGLSNIEKVAPSKPKDESPRTGESNGEETTQTETGKKHYAKALRLTSDQLKQLNLKPGPNTIQFSVTSSFSGLATCTARIFLWDEKDQIVISDIDGTITKSDALGHVFAAIGRDWTHLGIAKLYTDICNNGYKIVYLTSRAIGQADMTRDYLKTINQGDYRLPEGPVIMSPDRLYTSFHREVILRKPELFKMACLRDIQRLFGTHAKDAFFAGFGNRITDAMSYRSVGIETSKIYTIDSTGVVKTELLQAAGHKGSYIQLNDLVNEVFPPVNTKIRPEYTDFNFWRPTFQEIPLPDLTPPSPALSARSDTSGRLSVLGKIAGIGRRSSKQPLLPTTTSPSSHGDPSSRPSSPLIGPAMTPDDLSEAEDDDYSSSGRRKRQQSSMPGSFDDESDFFPESYKLREAEEGYGGKKELDDGFVGDDEGDGGEGGRGGDDGMRGGDDSFDDVFEDDLLATGEMRNVPF